MIPVSSLFKDLYEDRWGNPRDGQPVEQPERGKRLFVLLPFMHSESPLMQKESVRLHTALASPDNFKFAQGHQDVIARFGRFPRRNAALGRASTPEEEAYMASTQGMF